MLFKFSLYGFLKNLRFFEPFFLLYFLSKGLSYTSIGLLVSTRELSTYVLEIPSGLYADYFSKKSALLISFASYLSSFLLIGLFGSPYVFYGAMFLYGVGDAFRSGSHKGIIMEWLDQHHLSDQKHKYYGYTRSWSLMGSALSALIAAGLVVFFKGYQNIFLLSAIPYLLCFILLLTYPKSKTHRTAKPAQHMKSLFSHAVSPSIRNILINSALFGAVFKTVRDYLQPLLKHIAVTFTLVYIANKNDRLALLVGFFYFVIFILSSISSRKSEYITKKLGLDTQKSLNLSFYLFPLAILSGALSIQIQGQGRFVFLLFSFILMYVLFNIRKPLMVSYYGERMEPTHRASIFSIDSQIKSFLIIMLSPLMGGLADHFGPSNGLIIFTLILLPIFFIFRLKEKNISCKTENID